MNGMFGQPGFMYRYYSDLWASVSISNICSLIARPFTSSQVPIGNQSLTNIRINYLERLKDCKAHQ